MSAETITHIAGSWVSIDGRVFQRCAVCGSSLIDSKGMAAPLRPDGTAEPIATWPPGREVRVTIGNPTQYELLPDSQKIAEDSCLATVDLMPEL